MPKSTASCNSILALMYNATPWANVADNAANSYTSDGTMGQKLNNAAAGGVDYNALAEAVWLYSTSGMDVDNTAGKKLLELLTTGKFIALK